MLVVFFKYREIEGREFEAHILGILLSSWGDEMNWILPWWTARWQELAGNLLWVLDGMLLDVMLLGGMFQDGMLLGRVCRVILIRVVLEVT